MTHIGHVASEEGHKPGPEKTWAKTCLLQKIKLCSRGSLGCYNTFQSSSLISYSKLVTLWGHWKEMWNGTGGQNNKVLTNWKVLVSQAPVLNYNDVNKPFTVCWCKLWELRNCDTSGGTSSSMWLEGINLLSKMIRPNWERIACYYIQLWEV